MNRTAEQIHKHFKTLKGKVVLVAHQNPDGDALGATTAMAEYLRELECAPFIYCASPVPNKMQFLPLIDLVTQDPGVFEDASTVLVMDSGDTKHAGVIDILPNFAGTVLNIDHHATNTRFGHINLVLADAASTTQIVYHFLKHNNVRVSRSMATCLLTGLITDTDNFYNPATSEAALVTAGELLRLGANWSLINTWIIKNKSINLLKLWGVILSRLEKRDQTETAYTYLTLKDVLQYGIDEADAEGIANFLSKIDGAKVSLFMKETADGKIKGSLRTTNDDIDVSLIAKQMGGGGHKKAAGFTAEGPMKTIVDKVVEMQAQQ